MASGKTTVGRLLAALLGWRHLDLDSEIERHEGRTVASIFAAEGEAYFREREAELTVRTLASPEVVLSPGGGWVTNPALFDLLPADTLTVWLHASPGEIVRRLGPDEIRRRPLLSGPDVAERVSRLLAERDALYRRARLRVWTDRREPEEIAREIESIVRGSSAAPPPCR